MALSSLNGDYYGGFTETGYNIYDKLTAINNLTTKYDIFAQNSQVIAAIIIAIKLYFVNINQEVVH